MPKRQRSFDQLEKAAVNRHRRAARLLAEAHEIFSSPSPYLNSLMSAEDRMAARFLEPILESLYGRNWASILTGRQT